MRTLIQNATLVNEGKQFRASVLIEDEHISAVLPTAQPSSTAQPLPSADRVIDATNLLLLPGVIDDHVHFRDPGLTHKADMHTESLAALAGGVTSILDMPNTKPQTTDFQALDDKYAHASQECFVNYGFFFGATRQNTDLLPLLQERPNVPGVKLFMGSSTGNMLVDDHDALLQVFQKTPKDMVIMTHCEDTNIINRNMSRAQELYGPDPEVSHHPEIRSTEACLASTSLAIQLAQETGARLHVAHLTTAQELELFQAIPYSPSKRITAEACPAHLLFTEADYKTLGTRIKCNPAVKTLADRTALREALLNGKIDVIGTDHAPHLLSEKEGGCARAASGMPMVQFSLVAMLELSRQGVLPLEQVVNLMCHRPAQLFGIHKRGFIRPGYFADLVLLDPHKTWTLTPDRILSRCAWSPLEGTTFHNQVHTTFVNGHPYNDPHSAVHHSHPLTFRKE